MLLTDLLGDPVEVVPPSFTRKPLTIETFETFKAQQQKKQQKLYRKLQKRLEGSKNLLLFEEVLEYLRAPLVQVAIPSEFFSDCGKVPVVDEQDDEAETDAMIPYEPWGTPWFTYHYKSRTCSQVIGWSKEALLHLQVRLFWRSLEELGLNGNEQEKWSVLKWIFRPAIRKEHVYIARIGKSRCLQWHERDETFSFHNCCIAARMDEDVIREGVRRNVPAQIIEAVERVVLA
jgi:hypothetical protein